MFTAEAMPHPLTQIEIVHRLKKVGFTQEQAEVQTQIITEVNENSLATKQDVKNLAVASDSEFALVRGDINELKREMKELRQEMRSEFVLVRKEMELMKSDILVKITIIMSTLLAAFGTIQKVFGF